MKITQIKNGIQPRPYADHVWEWDIITEKSASDVLVYCLENLMYAEREEKKYWIDYRASHDFNKTMEIVCGGYYSLIKIEGGYKYRVTKDYID